MFDQNFIERLAQTLAARMAQLQNGNANGKPSAPKRLLTVKEAAAYLGRSVSAVYHLVARREIAVVRHGRNLRFDVRELDRWIEGDKI